MREGGIERDEGKREQLRKEREEAESEREKGRGNSQKESERMGRGERKRKKWRRRVMETTKGSERERKTRESPSQRRDKPRVEA